MIGNWDHSLLPLCTILHIYTYIPYPTSLFALIFSPSTSPRFLSLSPYLPFLPFIFFPFFSPSLPHLLTVCELDDPQFGSVSLSGVTIDSTATYQCDPGFNLVGPSIRTCMQISPDTADWDQEAPVCERMFLSIFDHCGSL